jgi:hypothetical protein
MIISSLTIKCSTNPYNHIYRDIQSGLAPTTNPSYSMITSQEAYNPMIMPTNVRGPLKHIDRNGSLKLALVMSLKQIVSLDEKNQILTTSFYL